MTVQIFKQGNNRLNVPWVVDLKLPPIFDDDHKIDVVVIADGNDSSLYARYRDPNGSWWGRLSEMLTGIQAAEELGGEDEAAWQAFHDAWEALTPVQGWELDELVETAEE